MSFIKCKYSLYPDYVYDYSLYSVFLDSTQTLFTHNYFEKFNTIIQIQPSLSDLQSTIA